MTKRPWMHCLDAPTLRATSRIESELYKLKEMTERRVEIINKRASWLEDTVHPIYETDEEDSPRGKRLIALADRVERHSQELVWRLGGINKAMTLMEEIGEFVSEVARKPTRDKRIEAAKAGGFTALVGKPRDT